jgi:hypothetical protein
VTRALLLALAVLLTLPAAAPARLQVGIGEQDPAFFDDARFQKLGLRHARLVVGWSALKSPWQTAELDAWLAAARRTGVEPMVSFGHARGGREMRLPSRRAFARQFRALRRRHPDVRLFQTWNEANHGTQPTWRHPRRVAGFHDDMRRICPRCTITAPSVLDMANMVSWVRRFDRAARRRVTIWSLHNHLDANRFRTEGTRALLRATRGQVWFTETGGIANRWVDGRRVKEYTVRNAARATRQIFRLARLSPRIRRVYLYHWRAPTVRRPRWDSAFIGPRGTPRPAYGVLRRELRRAR